MVHSCKIIWTCIRMALSWCRDKEPMQTKKLAAQPRWSWQTPGQVVQIFNAMPKVFLHFPSNPEKKKRECVRWVLNSWNSNNCEKLWVGFIWPFNFHVSQMTLSPSNCLWVIADRVIGVLWLFRSDLLGGKISWDIIQISFITYGPHKAVAEVSNHNEPIGRKSGIQLVQKSMDFTFNCFVLNWQID